MYTAVCIFPLSWKENDCFWVPDGNTMHVRSKQGGRIQYFVWFPPRWESSPTDRALYIFFCFCIYFEVYRATYCTAAALIPGDVLLVFNLLALFTYIFIRSVCLWSMQV
ncbi:unnamed protein product [Pylaiella littoralis]